MKNSSAGRGGGVCGVPPAGERLGPGARTGSDSSGRLTCSARLPRRLSSTARAAVRSTARASTETRSLAQDEERSARAFSLRVRRRRARPHQCLEGGLEILRVGRMPFVQDHEIDGQLFHPPVLVGAQQLTDDLQILDVVDPNQDDGQVARDPVRPQRRRSALASAEHFGGGAQRRVGVEDAVGETLEELRFVGPDAEMMELHLRLGPRQGDRALEGGRVMVLVDQVERLVAGRRDQRPERDARPWRPAESARSGED